MEYKAEGDEKQCLITNSVLTWKVTTTGHMGPGFNASFLTCIDWSLSSVVCVGGEIASNLFLEGHDPSLRAGWYRLLAYRKGSWCLGFA